MKIRLVVQVYFYYKGGYGPVEKEHTDRTVHQCTLGKLPADSTSFPPQISKTLFQTTQLAVSYTLTVTGLRLFYPDIT